VGWGRVRPFLIQSSTQFAVPAPPAVTSGDYAFAFREVYNKGRNTSPAPPLGRTVDEQDIGLFWSYDYKRGTPIRLYNQHAVQILSQEPEAPQVASPLHHHARMLALINLAMADAGIACWESKYRYNYWRPFQGIRLVDGAGNPIRDAAGNPIRDDGNPNTTHDRTWLPLGGPGGPRPNVTPNFPAYVSGHSSFGAAMFGMLRKFFGTKPFPFTLTSEEVANARRYADRRDPATNAIITSWTQAIDENSASRIYLGVHWRRDYTRGTPLGQQVADFIWPSFLRPTT
jgi:hypothetical protein